MWGWTLLACCLVHVCSGGEEKDFWERHEVLDEEGNYHLYWTFDDKKITFKVEAATKGWIGFGLSPDGGIPDSDIFIGWLKDDKVYYNDYYGKNSITILPDKSQDWEKVSGAENKTHTILMFSRKLDTCDPQDRIINNDTYHLLYAYYPKDPDSPKDIQYRQTMWNFRRFKLLRPRWLRIPMPDDVSYFDVRAANFTIPENKETLYYCMLHKLPRLKKKHHIIKFAPVIRLQNTPHVHHLCTYQCLPQKWSKAEMDIALRGGDCFDPVIARILSGCMTFKVCRAYNAGQFVYPQHVGLAIGLRTDHYWKLQIHYDNHDYQRGITDDSGLRFYYTPRLRPNESGFYPIGSTILNPSVVPIPPSQREYIMIGHGPPECISQGMPKTGMKIFAVFHHSHTLTKKIRLRHFRGNKELPPIGLDFHYSGMHQEYQFLPRDVTVLPGDHLITECSQDSLGRPITTFNGYGTPEEMCMVFIFHYPPSMISHCESAPSLKLLAELTGANINAKNCSTPRTPKDRLSRSKKSKNAGSSSTTTAYDGQIYCLREYLMDYNWPSERMCKIQNTLRYSQHEVFCTTTKQTPIKVPPTKYPDAIPYKERPDSCKSRRQKEIMSPRELVMESSCAENIA